MRSNNKEAASYYDDRALPEYGKIEFLPEPDKPQKQRPKAVKRVFIITGFVLIGIVIASGIVLAVNRNQTSDLASAGDDFTPAVADEPEQLTNRITFLLVGVDQRPEEKSFLTDSLILASVDPDTKIVSLLSIPRDSKVLNNIKINEVAYTYNMTKLITLISEITGVKIDGYVKTNFSGFKDIIDTLGGIDIYVEKKMKKETGDKEDGVIDLEIGQQHLDGTKALQYARYRNDSDIHRTARQQKVIIAMIKEALQAEMIPKLPQLISQVNKVVETDLKLIDLIKLAGMAKNFSSENIVSTTLPGQPYTSANGTSFWQIDLDAARKVTANLLKGISTNKVVTGNGIDMSQNQKQN